MRAIVFRRYGNPEVLRLEEVAKPVPRPDEVLIRVRASAVNDWDWSFVRGKPLALRVIFGLRKPKVNILGADVAGRIEAVGEGVGRFRPGDDVYGDLSESGFGAFAEYVCAPEGALAPKPATMSFEEAATIPHAAMLAMQGMIDVGRIGQRQREGLKVLINGAGGGVGMFGIRIAKQHGAEVTGVDSGEKAEMMRDAGFDHVIDYRKQDFTRIGERYDLILDAKTTRSPFAYLRALSPGGTYATVGGHLHRLLQLALTGPLLRAMSKKMLRIVSLRVNKDLAYINELFEAGELSFFIDGPFRLDEVPAAVQYFGEAKHRGKVVITVSQGG